MNILGQRTSIHDRLMMQLRLAAKPGQPVFIDERIKALCDIVQAEVDRLERLIDGKSAV